MASIPLPRARMRKRRRLVGLIMGLTGLGVAASLVLLAFQDTLLFFYAPSDVAERGIAPDQRFRLGGLVQTGSVARGSDGVTVHFAVTDGAASLPVTYRGLLPDLFREGQGVVAEGRIDQDGVFRADTVLAKHDENYMPPEVADALKRSGHWHEDAYGPTPP